MFFFKTLKINYIFFRQCDYYKYKYNYTYIKYSKSNKEIFYKTLINYLTMVHVPTKHINYLKNILHSIVTPHTTITKNETTFNKNYLYNSQDLLIKLCEMFYYDFIEFKFEMPDSCLQKEKT